MSDARRALPVDPPHPSDEDSPAVPQADPAEIADAKDAERGLRDSRPATIGALLAGTTLLRVGSYGSGLVLALVVPTILPSLSDSERAVLVGALGATHAISEMAFAPLLARWADRVGRSRFLVGGPVLGLIAVLIAATVGHPAALFVARVLEGMGSAAFVPTALGTIAAATSRNAHARANASGAFEAATLVGIAGGVGLAGFTHAAFGRGAFLVMAACYLGAAMVCAVFVPRVRPLAVSPLRTILRAVAGPGPIRSFLPAWMGTFAFLGAFISNLPALLARFPDGHGTIVDQRLVHSLDERLVSTILVAWVILLVVGIALWTPFLPRFGLAVTMRRAVPGAWVLAGGLLLANHLTGPLVALAIPVAITGIVWLSGFGPAAVAYLAECSETFMADRSALMAFYTVTLAAGGALGAILGGLCTALGHADGLFIFGIGATVFTWFSLRPVVRYEKALIRNLAGPVPLLEEGGSR
ncbi:MAG: MFS transporter [Candidatus Dormibacteria bacterium]